MSICNNCYSNLIISCTVDENGKHHSFNDEPSIISRVGNKYWHKHGEYHRENGPDEINRYGESVSWYYEGNSQIETNNYELFENVIIVYDYSFDANPIICVILKQIQDELWNVYLCLINNEKRYVVCK